MDAQAFGKVILLNGASSAGKSTLCKAIQRRAVEPFLRFSPDIILFGGEVLPQHLELDGPRSWVSMRSRVLDGYYRCLPALASAGNNLVTDIVLENGDQFRRLVALLSGYDVFFVGVHCPLPELERREVARGDRGRGDARRDFATVHTFSAYDLEIDSTLHPEANAEVILARWAERPSPTAFQKVAGDGARAGLPRL
jgi:chloramphenicol 3-O phosphotransferase